MYPTNTPATMSFATKRRNIIQLMRDREINDHIKTKYALKNNLNDKCIYKLGLLTHLDGHRGCVNCLQWNDSGSTLASASDDFNVILWDPSAQKMKTIIKTSHRGNIFTVKFLPSCNDDVVVTGAADWNSHTYNVTTGKCLSICTCARGRVKRIAVANDTPSVYWSASEDGCIRQHDMRMNHRCNSDQFKIGLVSVYNDMGKLTEAKCLDINQLRTEQVAVGANDPYVRLYDRRMIRSLASVSTQRPFPKNPSDFVFKLDSDGKLLEKANFSLDNIVRYFVPGYIHSNKPEVSNRNKNIGITYLTFSPNGQELLVNYGGEHVYLFDLSKQVENVYSYIPKVMKVYRENGEGTSKETLYYNPTPATKIKLPPKVEQLKLKANHCFEKQDYTTAINLYNSAIHISQSSVLFSNRAAAYIKRKWQGDYYAALKDCVTALKLEPNHLKAHFRLIVCLYELEMIEDSKIYLDQFKKKFPSYKTSEAFLRLDSSILNTQHSNSDKRNKEQKNINSPSERLKRKDGQNMMKNILEPYLRNKAKDYHKRYYGHCNTSTDIKEANFFGSQSQFIVAGSDDGLFFIWDKQTENNLLILKGDSSIVNCVQPHPSEFMLATSGIDSEVKLWAPLAEDLDNVYEIQHYNTTAMLNQQRMTADPFELIMRNMWRSVDVHNSDDLNVSILERSIAEQFYVFH